MVEKNPAKEFVEKYLQWDFNILPAKNNEKRPQIKWEKYQKEKYPRKQIDNWLSYGKENWVVVCGSISHNLVVLDFDDPKVYEEFTRKINPELLETFMVKSGKKGYHIYYYTPEPVKSEKIGKVDILGEGKLAVLPPSKHPETGRRYEIVKDKEPLRINDKEWGYILNILREITGKNAPGTPIQDNEKLKDNMVKIIETIIPYWREGQRDNLEVALLGYMRKKGVPKDIAKMIIEEIIKLTGDKEKSMRMANLERTYNFPPEKVAGYEGAKNNKITGLKEILSQKDLLKLERYVKAISPHRDKKEKLSKDKRKEKIKKVAYIALPDKLYLAVKGEQEDEYYFAYLEDGEVKIIPKIEIGGVIYEPRNPDGDPVYYPSVNIRNARYVETGELINLIKEHIKEYADLEPRDLDFAVYYILFTWFYRKVHTVLYLRFRGDTGKGKTRMLDTIGHLCFYPLITSGGSSRSAIMRAQEDYKGTLVLDETDLKGDKEHEMIKYINSGFEANKPFLLTNRNTGKRERYDNFCPKILGMRETFHDSASEGRIFDIFPMETLRSDIPPNLIKRYFEETKRLRDLIARWALENWQKIGDEDKYMKLIMQLPIEPRLKQLGSPLTILLPVLGEEYGKKLVNWLIQRQKEIAKDRADSPEGIIFNSVVDISQKILEDSEEKMDGEDLPKEDLFISTKMLEEDTGMSKRSINRKLHELGFETKRTHVRIADKRTSATVIYISNTRRWVEAWRRYRWGEELMDIPEFLKIPGLKYEDIGKYKELLNKMWKFNLDGGSLGLDGSHHGYTKEISAKKDEILRKLLFYFTNENRVHACSEPSEPSEPDISLPLVDNVQKGENEPFKITGSNVQINNVWGDDTSLPILDTTPSSMIIKVLHVPEEMKGRKIADIYCDLPPLKKGMVLIVSKEMARVLQKEGNSHLFR